MSPVCAVSIEHGVAFDPAALSAFVLQIKFKIASDSDAGRALRPIGIPRDRHNPPPYLAMLLELGNESLYRKTQSKIMCTPSKVPTEGEFHELTNDWEAALKALEDYRKLKSHAKKRMDTLKAAVKDTRQAMDACNCFSIFVRGTSPEVYGILDNTGISKQFATLLEIAKPSPADEEMVIQHMRPLERLGDGSAHIAWWSNYTMGGDLEDPENSEDSSTQSHS
jgi:hypothetical protein